MLGATGAVAVSTAVVWYGQSAAWQAVMPTEALLQSSVVNRQQGSLWCLHKQCFGGHARHPAQSLSPALLCVRQPAPSTELSAAQHDCLQCSLCSQG